MVLIQALKQAASPPTPYHPICPFALKHIIKYNKAEEESLGFKINVPSLKMHVS